MKDTEMKRLVETLRSWRRLRETPIIILDANVEILDENVQLSTNNIIQGNYDDFVGSNELIILLKDGKDFKINTEDVTYIKFIQADNLRSHIFLMQGNRCILIKHKINS